MNARHVLPLALALFASPAAAGPPAVCHPIATRGEVGIPVGKDGWTADDPELTPDRVLELARAGLAGSDETFVHMETIRRAVAGVTGIGPRPDVSGRERDRLVAAWLTTLDGAVETARTSARAGEPGALRRLALARFDRAYAAAALRQVGVRTDVDYARELELALAASEDDAAMHLGAAIACLDSRDRAALEHLSHALDAARDGLVLENAVSAAGAYLDARTADELRAEVRRRLGRA